MTGNTVERSGCSLLAAAIEAGLLDEQAARGIEELAQRMGVPLPGSGSPSVWPALQGAEPNPDLTFETLVACGSHEEVLRVARAVERGELSAYRNPVLLHGPVGSGKTHILSAIRHELGGRRCSLFSVLDLDTEYERARHLGSRAGLREGLNTVEVLLLDDLHLVAGHASLQSEIALLIERRHTLGRTLVLASALPASQLSHVEPHLRSRLEECSEVALGVPTTEERRAILDARLGSKQIPAQVADYLTRRISDVRRLKAVAQRLVALKADEDAPLTVEQVRRLMPEPHAGGTQNPSPPMEREAGGGRDRAARYKAMLLDSDTEEEQALALQIAVGDRLREMERGGDPLLKGQLERALELLREGRVRTALSCLAMASEREDSERAGPGAHLQTTPIEGRYQ